MRKEKKIDFVALVSDVIMIGTALLLVGITLLDFVGLLDQLNWLSDRVQVLTLLRPELPSPKYHYRAQESSGRYSEDPRSHHKKLHIRDTLPG